MNRLKVVGDIIAALFVLGLIFGDAEDPPTPLDDRAVPTATTTAAPHVSAPTTTRLPVSTSVENSPRTFRVSDVVDGDTVKLTQTYGGGIVTVRVLGIDTPETRDPRRGVGCYGPEASAWATRVLLGKTVTIRTDSTQDTRDRYGRLLAYVRLPSGLDYSTAAVRAGYAKHYVYQTPVSLAPRLRAAEASARTNGRGLWGPPCHGDITSQHISSDRETSASEAPQQDASAYYANCAAARAAGAAPLRRGDSGYGTHLDGDDDGVACE